MNIIPWQKSQTEFNSSTGVTQIWSASFEAEDCSCFTPLLSEFEIGCAERQMNKTVAHQKIISRGILRILLGNYLGLDPKELLFEASPYGKPFLSNPIKPEISFNLSHSGDLLLIALSKDKQIGIDVERIDEQIDFRSLSHMIFLDEEQLALSCSTNPIHDFYVLWTAREAILKLTGLGFSHPAHNFSVIRENKVPHFSTIPVEINSSHAYSLSSFIPADGYLAALATSQ
jgi:4'-phosphopantetheinyl transferase